MKKFFTLLCVMGLLASCSGKTQDYSNNTPTLDIRDYMNGHFDAHGVIFNWKGKATRHFTVSIDGSWEGNEGTLDERFTYADGSTDTRIWKLRFSDDHHFTATTEDARGIAKGSQYGNALNMKYDLYLPEDDVVVHIDDWMYLTDKGVLINRSDITKFGLPVGEVIIAFTKESS